ncbi:MAG TPA: type II and III secretion system protein family protein [Alphaproteobacteria bacterium]|nr:type II and III secretion system protein family protein [Alphaproteobacteria bacterium]
MRALRLLLALALVVGLGIADGGRRGAHAQELVPPKGAPIGLDVNQGTLIRLERNADTVFVANPAIADVMVKSPRLLYLYGKQPGETSLYAVDSEQHVLLARPVVIKRDLARLQAALHQLLPASTVDARAVDSSIVLVGNVRSSLEAEEARRIARPFVSDDKQLVDRLQVVTPNQVNLRVRVAEVSRNVIKELGINWDAIAHAGSFVFGLATGGPVFSSGTTFSTLTPGLNGTAQNSFFGGYHGQRNDVNALIDALDQNGLISILAEPNLTAMSGETASFLAGGEFPIVVPEGNQTVGVEFKPFGVALAFTPVVLNNGRISLRVRPEVSQLSTTGEVQIQGFTIPALSTRRAETTIELGSGQSFAIGGLLQNNIANTLNKVPGLGDVPVLGPLFRSTQFQRNESELVIIVTPYLVRPVSQHKMAAPSDGMTPPNDWDLYYRGRDVQPTAPVGGAAPLNAAGGKLIGPAGFILD